MNRRGFLAMLGAGAVAAADPTKAYSFLGFGKPKWKVVTGEYVATVQLGSKLARFDSALKSYYTDDKIDLLLHADNSFFRMVSRG